MTTLQDVLGSRVDSGSVPGAVGLVGRGDQVEVVAVGDVARDSIFRIASVSKPIVAAAVMLLVEDGRIALDDAVSRWLPELAAPMVVRSPSGPVDDVVPAVRAITIADLMTFRAGYGFGADFFAPAVALLFSDLKQGAPQPQAVVGPDEWTATLAGIPLLHQPGEAWLYNTCSDILGVLIARVTGEALPEFLARRVFGPLGMVDTGFHVPSEQLGRFTNAYQPGPDGPELVDAPDGQWAKPPAFPSGAGGLVSTVDDLHSFGRALLGDFLSPDSVRLMTTDHLTQAQRDASELFLEGQGWGFGGSVDVTARDPWNVPGRYGWVGGSGTTTHVVPSTGAVTVLLSQVSMTSPSPNELMRDFWRYAAVTPRASTAG